MSIYLGEGKTTVLSDMQGPAPDGFHVPLSTEWQAIYNAGASLGAWSSNGSVNFSTYLKMPFAGYRQNGNVYEVGLYGRYWSSSPNTSVYYQAYFLLIGAYASIYPQGSDESRNYGLSIRCMKNTPIKPTDSWTKLYGTSIESGGIFWSSSDGLISISSNGSTWYTLMDKNLGATTVYNYGDTLTDANCGYFYQWGNNYGFPHSGSVTTSSTTVDASTYGPGNYYESSTWITNNPWDYSSNNNLRGGTSQGSSTVVDTGIKSVYLGSTKAKAVYVGTTEVWNAWNSNWDNIDVLFSGENGTIIHGYNSSNGEIKLTDANGNITIIEDRNVGAVNINDYGSYIRADTAANYDSGGYHTPSQGELYNFIQTRNNITGYTNDGEKMRDILLMPFAGYTENGRNYDVGTTGYYLSRNNSSWAGTGHIRIGSGFISYYAQGFSNTGFTTIRRFKDT